VLAGIGIYGLIHYSVIQRTREIGIRMALGATPEQVVATFIRKAFIVILTGVALGAPLSVVEARIFSGLLYGLSPADPMTVGGGIATIILIGTVAALVPAFRATRLDPLRTLRQE
jgi:ABC-type antimicrobial peptide transport system permease subunit